MARLKITEEKKSEKENEATLNIADTIDQYFDANSNKKDADKIVKALAPIIKKYLQDNKLTEFRSNNHTAKITSTQSISYDEIKLLSIIKDLPKELQEGLVDKIEVVNMTALERAIIENKLDVTTFKDAEVTSVTTKLFVK